MLTWLKQRATEWERKSGEREGKDMEGGGGGRLSLPTAGCAR